jgi:hypothetical protein
MQEKVVKGLRYYPSLYPEELKKNMKYLSEGSWSGG